MTNNAFLNKMMTNLDAVPEGFVIDYLTGKKFKDTPEEYVRQNIEKALIKQYRYVPNDCHPEFRIKMGGAKPRVDIAIFRPGTKHSQENAIVIIETKKSKTNPSARIDGIDQLKSYMAACLNAQFGLWTNGDDRYCFIKRDNKGLLEFDEIVDIPILGQQEDDLNQPKRKDLMPVTGDNLLFAFRRCHNYIAGAMGLQKPDAFWELLKLIFCKIEDERSNILDFYVLPIELHGFTKAAPAKTRIQKIMNEKVIKKYSDIFLGPDREINLKANVVAFVVAQLQRYSLLASPVDVKGIAYEEIVGSNLRGDRGEFFTPRNACRMAVKMINPQPSEKLLDPACGTGGFLITAMNSSLESLHEQENSQWIDRNNPNPIEAEEFFRKRNEFLSTRVFGIDLNPSLVRASKMNMVMNNDGEGNLFQGDSLANPNIWDSDLRSRIQLGTIDVLFTNPPFGANIVIDDEDILNQYELAAVWDKQEDGLWQIRISKDGNRVFQKSQPPEILFIERCVQFLKPGTGRLAMVIPNGILNNPALGYVRQWIMQNVQLIAVVDMARDLFQPQNDTQTSMVLMRRFSQSEKSSYQKNRINYPVFMAVTEKIGHDKRGNTIYRQAPNGDDLLISRVEKLQQLDESTGIESQINLEVKERLVDDELPEVAISFLKWISAS